MKVFISYRREDCRSEAAIVYFALKGAMPDASVFFDVESIPIGADWVDAIETEINSADAVIVLIGDDWLSLRSRDGTVRILQPGDHVHTEVRLALERDVAVIPVLVEGALMPTLEELPAPLQGLARRNALAIRDSSLTSDAQRLAEVVRDHLQEFKREEPVVTPAGPPQLPTRFTEAWLGANVPSMGEDEFAALVQEMRARGWTNGDILDYAVAHLPPEQPPFPREPLGNPSGAAGFVTPARVTTQWLQRTAPDLTADEVAFLVGELERRNWSAGWIEDYLFAFVDRDTVGDLTF